MVDDGKLDNSLDIVFSVPSQDTSIYSNQVVRYLCFEVKGGLDQREYYEGGLSSYQKVRLYDNGKAVSKNQNDDFGSKYERELHDFVRLGEYNGEGGVDKRDYCWSFDKPLSKGEHKFSFEISDAYEYSNKVSRTINVQSTEAPNPAWYIEKIDDTWGYNDSIRLVVNRVPSADNLEYEYGTYSELGFYEGSFALDWYESIQNYDRNATAMESVNIEDLGEGEHTIVLTSMRDLEDELDYSLVAVANEGWLTTISWIENIEYNLNFAATFAWNEHPDTLKLYQNQKLTDFKMGMEYYDGMFLDHTELLDSDSNELTRSRKGVNLEYAIDIADPGVYDFYLRAVSEDSEVIDSLFVIRKFDVPNYDVIDFKSGLSDGDSLTSEGSFSVTAQNDYDIESSTSFTLVSWPGEDNEPTPDQVLEFYEAEMIHYFELGSFPSLEAGDEYSLDLSQIWDWGYSEDVLDSAWVSLCVGNSGFVECEKPHYIYYEGP
jgi:hypothetical protein